MFDPEIVEALAKLSADLGKVSPALAEVFQAANEGHLGEVEATARMITILQEDPSIAPKIEALAMKAFAPTREEPQLPQPPPPVEDAVAGNLIFEPNSEGLARLNPLYEAALAERAQFDGDIPEARFRPMPEGATPAVPVETKARNPVALGRMLEQASDEVHQEAKLLKDQYLNDVNALLEKQEAGLLEVGEETTLVRLLEQVPVEFEPSGYKTGQVPALRRVEAPATAELVNLSFEEKQAAAFKALATTQGRRSAVRIIRDAVADRLRARGVEVTVHEGDPKLVDSVVAFAEWTAGIYSSGSAQPGFSFIDVAIAVLTERLWKQLAGASLTQPVLEVLTINTVDVREVGWAARIIEG